MARGGRGGGSRGGGRSSSGRSGRSFSSRRSSSSSRGRSYRGSSHRGGGGYGGGPSHHHHHHGHHHGHHHHHYHGGSRGGSIVSTILASIIVFTILAIVVFQHTCNFAIAGCSGVFGGTSSSKQREKLDSGIVNMTEWYTDELGWIEYENDLIKGMESFYEDTGIQPHLYLVDWNGEISSTEAQKFMQEAYDDLFTDEGHMLVCYFSCHNDSIDFVDGEPFLLCGEATTTIMDEEAEKIFWSEEYKNYENNNLYFEEYWGETFKDAGNKIMAAPIPWSTVVIVIAAIVGVVIVVIIIKKIVNAKIAQKNKEQEDLERMLDKPLETFGDDAVEDLKDKYDNL